MRLLYVWRDNPNKRDPKLEMWMLMESSAQKKKHLQLNALVMIQRDKLIKRFFLKNWHNCEWLNLRICHYFMENILWRSWQNSCKNDLDTIIRIMHRKKLFYFYVYDAWEGFTAKSREQFKTLINSVYQSFTSSCTTIVFYIVISAYTWAAQDNSPLLPYILAFIYHHNKPLR